MAIKTISGLALFGTGVYLLAAEGAEQASFLLGLACVAAGFFLVVNADRKPKSKPGRSHAERNTGNGGGAHSDSDGASDSDGGDGNGGGNGGGD
jgi:hypothetical protein